MDKKLKVSISKNGYKLAKKYFIGQVILLKRNFYIEYLKNKYHKKKLGRKVSKLKNLLYLSSSLHKIKSTKKSQFYKFHYKEEDCIK